jgi:two-component SAPR family response regulator
VVEFRDGNYRIARSCEVRLDVVEFEQAARDARRAEEHRLADDALREYRRSLDCYRGELLADMMYEDWTVLPREALRVAYLECLGSAAMLHLQRGEHSEALSLAWSIIACDPAREDAHRLIMRCHAERGEVHQARRQFDLCRRELHSVLGVEPSPATVELLLALGAGV